MKKELNLVHPNAARLQGAVPEVSCAWELEGDELVVAFDTDLAGPPVVNRQLPSDSSQWGLWDWDVVEIFLAPDPESKTYYEFQASPLGQFFELEIFEPRARFNKDFVSGFGVKSELRGSSWKAELRIPLKKLGWPGAREDLSGNFFAILGAGEPRAHFSAFLPAQEKPDFHLPKHFKKLFEA